MKKVFSWRRPSWLKHPTIYLLLSLLWKLLNILYLKTKFRCRSMSLYHIMRTLADSLDLLHATPSKWVSACASRYRYYWQLTTGASVWTTSLGLTSQHMFIVLWDEHTLGVSLNGCDLGELYAAVCSSTGWSETSDYIGHWIHFTISSTRWACFTHRQGQWHVVAVSIRLTLCSNNSWLHMYDSVVVAPSMSTGHVVGEHCNCRTSGYWEQVAEHATISGCVRLSMLPLVGVSD